VVVQTELPNAAGQEESLGRDKMAKKDDYAGAYKYRTTGGKKYNFNVAADEPKKAPAPKAPKVSLAPAPAPSIMGRDVRDTNPPISAILPNPVFGGDLLDSPPIKRSMPDFERDMRREAVIKEANPITGAPLPASRPYDPETQEEKDAYRSGGRVRGDGVSRVKTKGRSV
jgi:hypothetical protein